MTGRSTRPPYTPARYYGNVMYAACGPKNKTRQINLTKRLRRVELSASDFTQNESHSQKDDVSVHYRKSVKDKTLNQWFNLWLEAQKEKCRLFIYSFHANWLKSNQMSLEFNMLDFRLSVTEMWSGHAFSSAIRKAFVFRTCMYCVWPPEGIFALFNIKVKPQTFCSCSNIITSPWVRLHVYSIFTFSRPLH